MIKGQLWYVKDASFAAQSVLGAKDLSTEFGIDATRPSKCGPVRALMATHDAGDLVRLLPRRCYTNTMAARDRVLCV